MENLEEVLKLYLTKFSPDDLVQFENQIFGEEVSRVKRAKYEYKNLDNIFKDEEELGKKYYSDMCQIKDLFDVVDFDSTVINRIYAEIIKIQLECNLKTKLYSCLAILKNELEKEKYFKKRKHK